MFLYFKFPKGFCLQIFLDWFANQETFSTLIEELGKKKTVQAKCSQVFFLRLRMFCKLCILGRRFFSFSVRIYKTWNKGSMRVDFF